jgi:2,3-bisphosphoglycerate-dependent phosphoglycerate mutase
MAYLVLVRHGTSEWNAKGLWTGWNDIDLAEKGKEEARQAGESIKDIRFDVAFTSNLIRAQHTLDEMLTVLNQTNVPVYKDHALDEKSYGDLAGKNKWEVKEKYGEEQWMKWRRAWNEPIPNGETLKMVYERIVPYYQNTILPYLKEGKNVLISAHGNSLRSLVKYLENISDADIEHLEIGLGEVYVYTIDNDGKITNKEIRASNPNAGKI